MYWLSSQKTVRQRDVRASQKGAFKTQSRKKIYFGERQARPAFSFEFHSRTCTYMNYIVFWARPGLFNFGSSQIANQRPIITGQQYFARPDFSMELSNTRGLPVLAALATQTATSAQLRKQKFLVKMSGTTTKDFKSGICAALTRLDLSSRRSRPQTAGPRLHPKGLVQVSRQ